MVLLARKMRIDETPSVLRAVVANQWSVESSQGRGGLHLCGHMVSLADGAPQARNYRLGIKYIYECTYDCFNLNDCLMKCFIILFYIDCCTSDSGKSFSRGARGQEKEKKRNFGGLLASPPPERNATRHFYSATNDFRYTQRSTDYRPMTHLTAGRGGHVSLCWGPLCPASRSPLFM